MIQGTKRYILRRAIQMKIAVSEFRRRMVGGFSFSAAAVAALLVLAATVAPARAQDNEVRINVGIAAAKPGDPIDIPMTLSGGEKTEVGSVALHVGVPKKLLTYTDMERGLAVELADGELKVAASDDKSDPSQTVLEVTASGKNPIKPGILGYLKFSVSNDAKKGVITLKLIDSKATAAAGGAFQLAKGDDGQLTIFAADEQIPVVGCFFFTH
jgi:cohesin domain-containing protein